MGFALLGENLLLVGFVLLASNAPSGSLIITDLVAPPLCSALAGCDPFVVDRSLWHQDRSAASAFLDAPQLHSVAGSGGPRFSVGPL